MRLKEEDKWFIDPLNGSDQNDGRTANTPLRTWAEWNRRCPVLTKSTVVHNLREDCTQRTFPNRKERRAAASQRK
jgi:hypothetical protein